MKLSQQLLLAAFLFLGSVQKTISFAELYQVKPGDTLSNIALRIYGRSLEGTERILTLNPEIKDSNALLIPGRLIEVDPPDHAAEIMKSEPGPDPDPGVLLDLENCSEIYVVKKGDTLSSISYKYFGRVIHGMKVLIPINPTIKNPHRIYVGQLVRLCVAKPAQPLKAISSQTPPNEASLMNTGITQLSFGPSLIRYQETGVSMFTESVLTAKGSFRRPLASPGWDFGVSGYLTSLILATNRANVSARFLGLNIQAGHVFSWPGYPWQLSLLAGWFYTTMFVSNDLFGFKHLNGPQVFPTLRRKINETNFIGAYLKYAPMTNGINVPKFSNREIALGLSWQKFFKEKGAVTFSVDCSKLDMKINLSQVSLTTLSASIGYAWIP